MAYYWATWLETALRKDPFVAPRIVTSRDWKTRGRPPSQFSFMPSGVLDHHTACMCKVGHRPDNCLGPIVNGHSGVPGPISQLLGTFTPLGVAWNGNNPDPRIIIVAAGRANHAGTGEWPWGAPNGNGSAIGIEWCGPPSTPWPDVVIELRARVTAAILKHNGWPLSRSTIHWEYARPQGRKIDPSGRWKQESNLAQTSHWNPDRWRSEVNRYLLAPIPIPPTPTPIPPTPTLNWAQTLCNSLPTLKRGAQGLPVKRMQHFLAFAGTMDPTNMANFDGVFGSGTEAALNRFLATGGRPQNGTCDDYVWNWFMATGDGVPTLRKGSNGGDVTRMQRMLSANGYMDPANQGNFDGQFGSGTETALKKFQSAKGLVADGICGQQSWTKLLK